MFLRPNIEYVTTNPDSGKVLLKITGHKVFGGHVSEVELLPVEWQNVQKFLAGQILIQDALPYRNASFRELFLTGMSEKQFQEFLGPEDDED